MIWIVTLCKPSFFPTRLGSFDNLAEAVAIARTHGATGLPERDNHQGVRFLLHDHEDDDNYAVWIERV